jgi:hypothetical protein
MSEHRILIDPVTLADYELVIVNYDELLVGRSDLCAGRARFSSANGLPTATADRKAFTKPFDPVAAPRNH